MNSVLYMKPSNEMNVHKKTNIPFNATLDNRIVFLSHHLVGVYSNYYTFVNRLNCDLALTRVVGESLQGNSQDEFANIIVDILDTTSRTLPFISMLIEFEISKATNKSVILRENNLCAKVITYFLKKVLRPFTKRILKNIITEIINSKHSFEIDQSKLPNSSQDVIQDNFNHVVSTCNKILQCLFQHKNNFPIEVTTICYTLWNVIELNYPDDEVLPPQLIGGILFLRIFCPFIATPDVNNLLQPGVKLTTNSRRSLIIISKTLQGISNITTSNDSPFTMTNDYLKQQVPLLHDFYKHLSKSCKTLEITDLITKDVPLNSCDLHLFFTLHRLFFDASQFSYKQQPSFINDSLEPTTLSPSQSPSFSSSSPVASFDNSSNNSLNTTSPPIISRPRSQYNRKQPTFLPLKTITPPVQQASPILLDKSKISKRRLFRRSLYTTGIDIENSFREMINIVGPPPINTVTKKKKIVEWEGGDRINDVELLLAEERIFFVGGTTNTGNTIVYLIVKRLIDLLSINSEMVMQWSDVVNDVLDKMSNFVLVVDCSWFANVGSVEWRNILKVVCEIKRIKRSKQTPFTTYLLQPTKGVVDSFMGVYGEVEIVKHYGKLEELWGEQNLIIPEDSKGFVKKLLNVQMSHGKGKTLEGYIVLSLGEIYIIREDGIKISWAISIHDIDKIIAFDKKSGIMVDFINEKKLEPITLHFNDIKDRNMFMGLLYTSSFYCSMLSDTCLCISASKLEQKKGKVVGGETCLLVICLDCIMIKKGNKIKKEIRFPSIHHISVLPYDDSKLLVEIEFKDVQSPSLNEVIQKWFIKKENESFREKCNFMIEKYNDTKNVMKM
ncbi:Ras-GAP domain-containing protein [Entamoeba marina]